MRYFLTIFATVFLAELGDKTQLATMLFATRKDISKLVVLAAAALALVTATSLAVVVGDRLSGWIAPPVLQTIAGLGFILIGILMLVTVYRPG